MALAACVSAQSAYEYGITEADLESLEPELGGRVKEALLGARTDEDRRSALDQVLSESALPTQLRYDLTVKRAELAPSVEESVSIYESLLDTGDGLDHAAIRGRIMLAIDESSKFGSPIERLSRIDRLMEPVLEIPRNQYQLDTMVVVATYGDCIRLLGHQASLELLDPGRVEASGIDRRILAAQVALYYGEQSRDILTELRAVLKEQLAEVDSSQDTHNSSAGWTVSTCMEIIDDYLADTIEMIAKKTEMLEKFGAKVDEGVAVAAIQQYLIAVEVKPADRGEIEADKIEKLRALDETRAHRREKLQRDAMERAAADTALEYGPPHGADTPAPPK